MRETQRTAQSTLSSNSGWRLIMSKNRLLALICSLFTLILSTTHASAWSPFQTTSPGYTFELLGETYTVPFDCQKLLDNGWIPKYGSCPVEADSRCYLYFIYSETVEPEEEEEEEPEFEVHTEAAGYVLSVMLENTASNAVSYSECKVISAIGNLNPAGVFLYEKLTPHSTFADIISMYGEPTSQTDSTLLYIADGRSVRNADEPERHLIVSHSAKHNGDLTVTIHNDGK